MTSRCPGACALPLPSTPIWNLFKTLNKRSHSCREPPFTLLLYAVMGAGGRPLKTPERGPSPGGRNQGTSSSSPAPLRSGGWERGPPYRLILPVPLGEGPSVTSTCVTVQGPGSLSLSSRELQSRPRRGQAGCGLAAEATGAETASPERRPRAGVGWGAWACSSDAPWNVLLRSSTPPACAPHH